MKYIGYVSENIKGAHNFVKEWKESLTVFLLIPLAVEPSLCCLHLQVNFLHGIKMTSRTIQGYSLLIHIQVNLFQQSLNRNPNLSSQVTLNHTITPEIITGKKGMVNGGSIPSTAVGCLTRENCVITLKTLTSRQILVRIWLRIVFLFS